MDKEIKNLKRQIEIKDKYCQLLIDIGFDYDGYDSVKSLTNLINELVSYAQYAIDCNDKIVIYIDGNNQKSNILNEPIKRGEKDV